MARVGISERRAEYAEVDGHRDALREAVKRAGLSRPRLRSDGTVIVHSNAPDYSQVLTFAAEARRIVGSYVHVVTDGTPAGRSELPDL